MCKIHPSFPTVFNHKKCATDYGRRLLLRLPKICSSYGGGFLTRVDQAKHVGALLSASLHSSHPFIRETTQSSINSSFHSSIHSVSQSVIHSFMHACILSFFLYFFLSFFLPFFLSFFLSLFLSFFLSFITVLDSFTHSSMCSAMHPITHSFNLDNTSRILN